MLRVGMVSAAMLQQKHLSFWFKSALAGCCERICISCGCVRPGIVLYLSSFDRISFSTRSCTANFVTSHMAPELHSIQLHFYRLCVIRLCNFKKNWDKGSKMEPKRIRKVQKMAPIYSPLFHRCMKQNQDRENMPSCTKCDTFLG